jgi:hypothetical protein
MASWLEGVGSAVEIVLSFGWMCAQMFEDGGECSYRTALRPYSSSILEQRFRS